MKTSELIEIRIARLRTVARALHLSLATERTYCGWVRRFIAFSAQGTWICLSAASSRRTPRNGRSPLRTKFRNALVSAGTAFA